MATNGRGPHENNRMDFSKAKVLCVGDVMLDKFLHGEIERISPEAPVPVFRLTSTREMLGGAGNVAHNISALGGCAILVGLCADDEAGRTVRTILNAMTSVKCALITTQSRPTICKTRLVAGNQQVVRADIESQLPLQPIEESDILEMIRASIEQVDVLVLSDYGKGVLSDKVIRFGLSLAQTRGIPAFVDPKSKDFRRYAGATCITPNLKELAAASQMPVNDESSVIAAARRVMSDSEMRASWLRDRKKG